MYKKILFPIDLDEKSSLVNCIKQVTAMAGAFNAEIHVITVIPDYGMSMVEQYFPKGWIEETIGKAGEELNFLINQHFAEPEKVKSKVLRGAIYQCVIDEAREINADLIIMCAHRPELSDYLLGPNAAKIVRHASTSVMVVR